MEEIILADFKTYDILIKTIWHWLRNRQTNAQNRIENSEINTSKQTHLIFNTGKKQFNGRNIPFTTNSAGGSMHP